MFQHALQSEDLVKVVAHEVHRPPHVRVLHGNRVRGAAGDNSVGRYSHVQGRRGAAIHEVLQHAGCLVADVPCGRETLLNVGWQNSHAVRSLSMPSTATSWGTFQPSRKHSSISTRAR